MNQYKNNYKRLAQVARILMLSSLSLMPGLSTANNNPVYLDQGTKWTQADRKDYYNLDQGSQLIPLKWIMALKQANGKPFMENNLGRYGYLPNETSPTTGLPLGFAVNQDNIGMSCAACHNRQIEVDHVNYRIDGGPAFVDFQGLAADLRQAVSLILTDNNAFNDFAQTVLGNSASAAQQTQLHQEVETWFLPYSTIMDNALPLQTTWGPGRVDAVGMIFNRLTGLDIGTGPDHIIKNNIHRAEAPVRYPFVWNAPIQDKTQWPGFADNGNAILALSRNLGEVIGVFAHFNPKKDDFRILGVDFLQVNSANFEGLKNAENLIKKIGPPKWPWKKGPWAINQALAAQGKLIYESSTKTEVGGCASCHGIRPGAVRSLQKTWATPLCNVGTDTKEYDLLTWKVNTGVLAGAQVPFLAQPLKAENELAVNVLKLTVLGSVLQQSSPLIMELENSAQKDLLEIEKTLGLENDAKLQQKIAKLHDLQVKLINPGNIDLNGAIHTLSDAWEQAGNTKSSCKIEFTTPAPKFAFEAKVLEGIWAAAPYFHNGSVPTLTDLLKPVAERTATFKVGPVFDPINVGLAAMQTNSTFTYNTTTDCADPKSGNSRCGHEYGVNLLPEEKKALLEYLKTL